jgi:phosphatidylglycerophosphatase A
LSAAPSLAARLATLGGIGRLPEAPGTWASLATLPLAWGLHWAGGFPLVAAATLALTFAGFWATRIYLAETGRDDPPEIVIDEAAGMLLALWPLSLGLWAQGVDGAVFPWPGWTLGFVAFRFFDIVKPPPVGWADRRPGALGVMLDDLLAGLLAALVASAAAVVAHGVLA